MNNSVKLGFDAERRLSLEAPLPRVLQAVARSNAQTNNAKVRLGDIFPPHPRDSDEEIKLSFDAKAFAALRKKYGLEALAKVGIFLQHLLDRDETDSLPDGNLVKVDQYRPYSNRLIVVKALIKRPARGGADVRKVVSTNIGPLAHDLSYFPRAKTLGETRRRINSNFRYNNTGVALQLGRWAEFCTPPEGFEPESQYFTLRSRKVLAVEASMLCLAAAAAIAHADSLACEELPS